MPEKPESTQNGFVLPKECPIADRPHRAYDVRVDQKTYDWLSQTPKSSRVSFVPLGNIPERSTGYLTRGDGPKAVLDVQEGTRIRLPKVVGVSSDEIETISRLEAIAQRIVNFICEELLKLQGDDLNNLVIKGLKLTVPKDLVSDIGFDATFVPHLGKGSGSGEGWVPNSQDAGSGQRKSWLWGLKGNVNARVKQFIADRLQVQKGRLMTNNKAFENPRCFYRELTPDLLNAMCEVDCDGDSKDSFTVAISFPMYKLDHPVSSPEDFGKLIPSHPVQRTETMWLELPSRISWKPVLEKAA